ncbi:MAG: hypothetical protein IJG84_17215, partial [Kiritimatiellae bacterium]|nr:hypothetical protein [Kiritimatiellia bacterium]
RFGDGLCRFGRTMWRGLVPTNLESTLKARIEMQGETPIVTWDPNLNEDGVERRLYKVYGSETLENGGEWQYPTNSLHRFFKALVERRRGRVDQQTKIW